MLVGAGGTIPKHVQANLAKLTRTPALTNCARHAPTARAGQPGQAAQQAAHRDRLIRFLDLNFNFVAGLAAGYDYPNAPDNGVQYHCAQIIAA